MIKALRGMRDILPEESPLWQFVEDKARAVMERYCYKEIRTPLVEETALFTRSIGEYTDIVNKEMYTFQDRKGRSISLRPEGTAPIVRAYLEHKLHAKTGILRLYYIGPFFRYERPQAGRNRQFHQVGAELIGSAQPEGDIEIISLAWDFLQEVGLKDLKLLINSIGCRQCQPGYKEELVQFLKERRDELCPDCRGRLKRNPLRVLDCKEEKCRKVKQDAPSILDYLCQDCKQHFERVKELLEKIGISYTVDAQLVRGLDYYTRTTFEIIHTALGAQNAVAAGGRYDELISDLGGPDIPAVGFAAGVDRIIMLLQELRGAVESKGVDIYIAAMGDEARERGVIAAYQLRKMGLCVRGDFEEKSLKSHLRAANKAQARFVLLMGDEEVQRNKVILKDMSEGEQQELDWGNWKAIAAKVCGKA